MNKKIFKQTDKTPEIIFDYTENRVSIRGICVPENPLLFFQPVYEEIESHCPKVKTLLFSICLEYFNTGASKCLLDLLIKPSRFDHLAGNVTVDWLIETGDLELREAGEVFEEITNLKFNYIEFNRN